ncbi:MAG: Uncharacterised protein [Flavobacteriia bacterium]|nr:MAG: Uncharacterised protein [Flavobacteriia bacterium]
MAVFLFPKKIDVRIDLMEDVAVVGAQVAGAPMSFQHICAAGLFVQADRFTKSCAQKIHPQNMPP